MGIGNHGSLDWVLTQRSDEVKAKFEQLSVFPLKADPPLDEVLQEAQTSGLLLHASPYSLTPEGKQQIHRKVLGFLRKKVVAIVKASLLRRGKCTMLQKEIVDEFRLQLTYLFNQPRLQKMKDMILTQLPGKEALANLLMSVYVLEEASKRGLLSHKAEYVTCEKEKLLFFRHQRILRFLVI